MALGCWMNVFNHPVHGEQLGRCTYDTRSDAESSGGSDYAYVRTVFMTAQAMPPKRWVVDPEAEINEDSGYFTANIDDNKPRMANSSTVESWSGRVEVHGDVKAVTFDMAHAIAAFMNGRYSG